jgi:two-component system cell cycle response regulator
MILLREILKKIYLYEKDADSIRFLDDFFRGHKAYDASFFTSLKELKRRLREEKPDVLIVGSPSCLEMLKPANNEEYLMLAMLSSKDMPKGLRSIINSDVEHYIYPPYQKFDLEHKLRILNKKTDYVQTLFQEKKDIEAISNILHLLTSTLDPQEVLYMIVKRLSEIIPVTRCSILSVDFSRSKTADVISTFEDPSIEDLTLNLDKYPEIRKALSTKKAVVIRDASKDPLMREVRDIIKPLGIKSIVVMPVLFRNEVIGTLFLRTSRRTHVFSDREIKLCQRVANASANALNNAFLFQKIQHERAKLEKLAITDFLTGIYNIRYLYHRLEDEFSRSVRYKSPLSCIMFDIDHFKLINDNYGHRTGDIVLREFAGLIKQHIRKSDVFARYGGEEFIMILPLTDLKGAMTEGKRIKNTVKNYRFNSLNPDTRITVSLGVSCYPNKKIKIQDDLIMLADDALMQAKATGRDKIMAIK